MESRIYDDRGKWRELFKTYSTDELLSRARTLAEERDYLKANVAFRILLENSKTREIAKLYVSVIKADLLMGLREAKNMLGESSSKEIESAENDLAAKALMGEMINAMELHKDKLLHERDLFNIEKIVDKFPFKKIEIPVECSTIYEEFKLYAEKIREMNN
jgi:hypothetical protein